MSHEAIQNAMIVLLAIGGIATLASLAIVITHLKKVSDRVDKILRESK